MQYVPGTNSTCRAPTNSEPVRDTSPPLPTATFVVPPPISRLITQRSGCAGQRAGVRLKCQPCFEARIAGRRHEHIAHARADQLNERRRIGLLCGEPRHQRSAAEDRFVPGGGRQPLVEKLFEPDFVKTGWRKRSELDRGTKDFANVREFVPAGNHILREPSLRRDAAAGRRAEVESYESDVSHS